MLIVSNNSECARKYARKVCYCMHYMLYDCDSLYNNI